MPATIHKAGVAIFLAGRLVFAFAKPITAEQIIRNSVSANERDWRAAPEFSYIETVRDSSGSKTNRVIMLFGSPYRELLKADGKPISSQEREREQKKLAEATAQRQSESAADRASRVAQYEKSRQRDHLMMEQLTSAFDFRLTGQKHVLGRNVYTLQATPRPDYQPPNMQAEVLKGMKGELWIDRESFQWVRVVAQVLSPVRIGGFLATVEPGTFFELEKAPVEGDIWLPSRFKVRSTSRILGLFKHSTQEDDTYYEYRKSQFMTARK